MKTMLTQNSSYEEAYNWVTEFIEESKMSEKDKKFHIDFWNRAVEDYPQYPVYKGMIQAYKDSLEGGRNETEKTRFN